MAFSYNLDTDTGRMRAMIPDNQPASYIFEDAELDVFMAIEGRLKRAVALALETIASNEVMVLKVIRILDITTDGAKVSDALLKRAALLRKQADDEDADENEGGVDWAEMILDTFQRREKARRW